MIRWLLFALLCGALSPVTAAEAPRPAPAPSTAPLPAPAPAPAETPRRPPPAPTFTPSEKIQADSAVAFPVDI